MYRPTLEEVKKLASQGNLVPVYREIMADMETPVSAFLKIARGPHSFLLESVEGGERLARYSFIGTEPYMVIKTGPGQPAGAVDPLVQVERELKGVKPVVVPGLPRFLGGAVGYLSYETVRYFEPRVPATEPDTLGVPESVFMFTDTLLVFDHVKHKIQLVSHVHTDGDIEQEYMAAVARIEWLAERLRHPLELQKRHVPAPSPAECAPVPNMTQEQYEAMVSSAREYISAGDVIQVVLSQRLRRRTSVEPFDIYRSLRMLNPSPYMYYLHLDDFDIVGASPELLVRVEDGMVATHPIAGTRPRGRTPEEDARLESDLRTDAKERAEHIMLVDLGRNDIGRVSEPGTVKVTELMGVERYSHVMHLVSHVTGKLSAGLTAYDALRACFPAGTVSGAPKIRAMEIIAEKEPERRGPYAGAVGYFSFSGNMDTCITIRTIVVKDGVACVQAGGGIVYDSTPVGEFRESLQKMEGPLRAIIEAEEQVAAHADEPRSHLRRAAR
ncbi:MAG: anthranilate synthase component I [Dehalococcoidia bacterium]|nr:anthranilate synthase component I [Dehalococcoidia bacterium]